MGNFFSSCKTDGQQIVKLLLQCIYTKDHHQFKSILESCNEPLPLTAINVYQQLVIYSPTMSLEQMTKFCEIIQNTVYNMLPKVSDYYQPYFGQRVTEATRYKYGKTGDFTRYEVEAIFNDAQFDLEVNNSALILAKRIKCFVFEQKFCQKLDMAIIDKLIETFGKMEASNISRTSIVISNNSQLMKRPLMIALLKLIKEKNLFQIDRYFIENVEKIRPLFELNGRSIYHILVICSLYYTLDEIKQLSIIICKYCSPQNVNMIASTENYLGVLQRSGKVEIIESASGNQYYDQELEMDISIQAQHTVQFNKLRPITIAYLLKDTLFNNIVNPTLKLNMEVIDHVILTLSSRHMVNVLPTLETLDNLIVR